MRTLKKTALVRDHRDGRYVTWLAVPRRTTSEEARETFEERYGREPKAVRREPSGRGQYNGAALVGPVFSDVVPGVRCSFD